MFSVGSQAAPILNSVAIFVSVVGQFLFASGCKTCAPIFILEEGCAIKPISNVTELFEPYSGMRTPK
jgi:hypothetical protein